MMRLLKPALIIALAGVAVGAQAIDFKLDFNRLKSMGEKVGQLKPMSEEQEIELGRGVAANLAGAAPLVDDPALQAYVNKVGLWLALHSARPDLPWRFGVLDTDAVNAFATPGGYVLITRGLLLRLRDEAELAGVLAHEIGHVVDRHALETMRKGAIAGLAGDVLSEYAEQKGKEGYAKLVNASTEVYARGLDKDDEYSADRHGVVIAARAGYDPYGLAGALQTLASINPQDNAVALMFKTHPAADQRLERLVKAMEGRFQSKPTNKATTDRFAQMMRSHLSKSSKTGR